MTDQEPAGLRFRDATERLRWRNFFDKKARALGADLVDAGRQADLYIQQERDRDPDATAPTWSRDEWRRHCCEMKSDAFPPGTTPRARAAIVWGPSVAALLYGPAKVSKDRKSTEDDPPRISETELERRVIHLIYAMHLGQHEDAITDVVRDATNVTGSTEYPIEWAHARAKTLAWRLLGATTTAPAEVAPEVDHYQRIVDSERIMDPGTWGEAHPECQTCEWQVEPVTDMSRRPVASRGHGWILAPDNGKIPHATAETEPGVPLRLMMCPDCNPSPNAAGIKTGANQ